jgi:hypothetical protein
MKGGKVIRDETGIWHAENPKQKYGVKEAEVLNIFKKYEHRSHRLGVIVESELNRGEFWVTLRCSYYIDVLSMDDLETVVQLLKDIVDLRRMSDIQHDADIRSQHPPDEKDTKGIAEYKDAIFKLGTHANYTDAIEHAFWYAKNTRDETYELAASADAADAAAADAVHANIVIPTSVLMTTLERIISDNEQKKAEKRPPLLFNALISNKKYAKAFAIQGITNITKLQEEIEKREKEGQGGVEGGSKKYKRRKRQTRNVKSRKSKKYRK